MSDAFLLGVNYWPRKTAMSMWKEPVTVRTWADDLEEIKALGLRIVRFFLFWEDFQPTPDSINPAAMKSLLAFAHEAKQQDLLLMPTFFVGHMSGVNFLPAWTRRVGESTVGPFAQLFRRLPQQPYEVGDLYQEESLLEAQCLFVSTVARALRGCTALYAYDLGNEPSLVRAPGSPVIAARWVTCLRDAIRREDATARVTVGTFQGDLEHNTGFWPSMLREKSDFLSVHGYPSYAPWTGNTLDSDCLPFLVQLTRSLAGGGEALVGEFGAPYAPYGFSEQEMAVFLEQTLPKIHEVGALGAVLWNFSDYEQSLSETAPFDNAKHELSFGLFRADGTRKESALALRDFAMQHRTVRTCKPVFSLFEESFYESPYQQLCSLYATYKASRAQ